MPAEKALALVVRGTDWSETSRITTLFTREHGRVRALAKGGRRLRSSFEIAFDLLTVCHVVFLRKAGGGLDLLTEAQVAERFPVLRTNLAALNSGYYIAELLADGTQDYDPHPPVFDVALDSLRRLGDSSRITSAGRESQPVSVAHSSAGLASLDSVTTFELVWLRELGYSPRLDACAGCGSEPLPVGESWVAFSPSMGGVLCPTCGPEAGDRRPLTGAGLEALRELTRGAVLSMFGAGIRVELRSLLGHLVSTVLGRRPRLLGYVEGR